MKRLDISHYKIFDEKNTKGKHFDIQSFGKRYSYHTKKNIKK